eukprot:1862277-Lingulodinium_polyedra.AAC.1
MRRQLACRALLRCRESSACIASTDLSEINANLNRATCLDSNGRSSRSAPLPKASICSRPSE